MYKIYLMAEVSIAQPSELERKVFLLTRSEFGVEMYTQRSQDRYYH